MRRPAAQRRSLAVMETMLETSAPRLTAMFAMFTRLAADEEPVRAERPSAGGRRLNRSLLLLLPMAALIMLVVSLVLGFPADGASACASTAHPHTTGCQIPGHK
jgi:hypothetical protein